MQSDDEDTESGDAGEDCELVCEADGDLVESGCEPSIAAAVRACSSIQGGISCISPKNTMRAELMS